METVRTSETAVYFIKETTWCYIHKAINVILFLLFVRIYKYYYLIMCDKLFKNI
jgi:hypothetical protein